MTRRGLGYRVVLKRIREPCAALDEPGESPAQLRTELLEVALTKAVDGDQNDERRLRRDGR